MYFYYSQDGRVKMISQRKIKSTLNSVKVALEKGEQEKIDEGMILYYIDGKIQFKQNPSMAKREEMRSRTLAKQEFLAKKNPTSEEITQFIKDFVL